MNISSQESDIYERKISTTLTKDINICKLKVDTLPTKKNMLVDSQHSKNFYFEYNYLEDKKIITQIDYKNKRSPKDLALGCLTSQQVVQELSVVSREDIKQKELKQKKHKGLPPDYENTFSILYENNHRIDNVISMKVSALCIDEQYIKLPFATYLKII